MPKALFPIVKVCCGVILLAVTVNLDALPTLIFPLSSTAKLCVPALSCVTKLKVLPLVPEPREVNLVDEAAVVVPIIRLEPSKMKLALPVKTEEPLQ